LGRSSERLIRRLLLMGVVIGALVAPLGAELAWRAEAQPGAHAQPEVAVIERAGDRVATGGSPYLAHPTTVGSLPHSDDPSVDRDSYFPYLPGMVIFGLPNGFTGVRAL